MPAIRLWESSLFLSLPNAAEVLSEITHSPVSTVDVVQWAAKGDFVISLNLSAGQWVQMGRLFDSDQTPIYVLEKIGPSKNIEGSFLFEYSREFQLSHRSILDLMPISLGRKSLDLFALSLMDKPSEQHLHRLPSGLKDAPTKKSTAEAGYFVQGWDDEESAFDCFMLLEQDQKGRLQSAIDAPHDAVVVVTPRAIIEFEQKQENQSDSGGSAGERVAKPLGVTERNTLLLIIAALCTELGIDPAERGAAKKIEGYTEKKGSRVSEDTIKRHLARIRDALESRQKDALESRQK